MQRSSLRLARAIPVVFVADVPASAAFYRDALGFSIDFRDPDGNTICFAGRSAAG